MISKDHIVRNVQDRAKTVVVMADKMTALCQFPVCISDYLISFLIPL